MSRGLRVLGAAAVACAAVPLVGVGAASAAVASETAAVAGYYWSANPGTVQGPGPIGAQKPFPDQAKSTDGVAEDDLAVAVTTVDSVDKFSTLRWDLDALVPGSVVSKAVIVLPLSDNTGSRRTPTAVPESVVACGVGDQGFADADAEPFIDAPKIMCAAFSATAKPVDGAYEFDITVLAQKWVDSNDGVAIYPSAKGLKEPFQQVFAPKSKARLTIAFTPPAPDVVTPELPETPVDTGTVDTGSIGTGSTGGFDEGSFSPGTAPLPAIGTIDAPPAVAVPQPQAQPAPQTAPQAQAFVPAAASSSPMRFDATTWAAIGGGAVLLLLASMTLGAAPAPAAPVVRSGGVGEQLARRQQRPRAARPGLA